MEFKRGGRELQLWQVFEVKDIVGLSTNNNT